MDDNHHDQEQYHVQDVNPSPEFQPCLNQLIEELIQNQQQSNFIQNK